MGDDEYEEHPTAEDDMKDIYNAFYQLRTYIENQEAPMNEAKLKDFIKTGKIHSSIPAGSLTKVLAKNPELSKAARNAANPAGQAAAFKEISPRSGR